LSKKIVEQARALLSNLIKKELEAGNCAYEIAQSLKLHPDTIKIFIKKMQLIKLSIENEVDFFRDLLSNRHSPEEKESLLNSYHLMERVTGKLLYTANTVRTVDGWLDENPNFFTFEEEKPITEEIIVKPVQPTKPVKPSQLSKTVKPASIKVFYKHANDDTPKQEESVKLISSLPKEKIIYKPKSVNSFIDEETIDKIKEHYLKGSRREDVASLLNVDINEVSKIFKAQPIKRKEIPAAQIMEKVKAEIFNGSTLSQLVNEFPRVSKLKLSLYYKKYKAKKKKLQFVVDEFEENQTDERKTPTAFLRVKEREAMALEMYNQNVAVEIIAKKSKLSISHILKMLMEQNLYTPYFVKSEDLKQTIKLNDYVVMLYKKGWFLNDIEYETQLSVADIKKCLTVAGFVLAQKEKFLVSKKTPRHKKYIEMYLAGKSPFEIAEFFREEEHVVINALRKAKIYKKE
jgi:hypothetical protein